MKRSLDLTTYFGPLAALIVGVTVQVTAAGVVDFERFSVDGAPYTLGAEDSYHGYDSEPSPINELPEVHPFTCAGAEFHNAYGDYTYQGFSYYGWEGWAVSNVTDTTTPGYLNEYSAITGGGVCGSSNYGVAYLPDNSWWGGDPATEVYRRAPIEVAHTEIGGHHGVYITNTTYAYLAMLNGEGPARAFTAENNDYLCLTITGLDKQGTAVAGLETVDFYLADFRQSREPGAVEGDYIVDGWAWVDLSSFVEGGADQLQFVLSSADVGDYGINTPVYFAMDNLPSIPGDASLDGVVNRVDALILASNWGEQGGAHWVEGDFNADGVVGPADASLMAANWGQSVWPDKEGSSAVPEPSVMALLAGLLFGWGTLWRRGR
ncbi:MAG: DUF4465 domain-containing protein [Pirellulales bacterium]|nr:DUF4465 domain-containing protein [Pirellulales bacterium]